MNKIKYKLNKNELKAVMFMLKLIEEHGQHSGLEGKASMEILRKVYLSLLNRWAGLKQGTNSFTLSFSEAWALSFQVDRVNIYMAHMRPTCGLICGHLLINQ
ncbi:MAG: hypothetical protein R2764_01420 [Bacteroidales bacterium]